MSPQANVFAARLTNVITIMYFLFILLFTIYTSEVSGDYITKGSLTFVIDNTFSMTDDIKQVLESANKIFETVLKTETSQIQNYVIVTFNDPGTVLRTVTENRTVLVETLKNITVTEPNFDCPELSMEGITLGLTESMAFSYLYVFTDASAKDFNRYEQVKNLAAKKQAQVDFMLTGECYEGRESPKYQVYLGLAAATSGQVFNLEKDEIGDILKYVTESVTGQRNIILFKNVPPGQNLKYTSPPNGGHQIGSKPILQSSNDIKISLNFARRQPYSISPRIYNYICNMINIKDVSVQKAKIIIETWLLQLDYEETEKFTIDDKYDDILISVSGKKPALNIVGPNGGKAVVETIFDKNENIIQKITKPEAGIYQLMLGSKSDITIHISGQSIITFRHGFSKFRSTSMTDTTTIPEADDNVYLLVQLNGEGVVLKTVNVINDDDSIYAELLLEIIDEKENLYGTAHFNPPQRFRIVVVGYDIEKNTSVIRAARSPFDRSDSRNGVEGATVYKKPIVNLTTDSQIVVEYGTPVEIICQVEAYPKPVIVWIEKDSEAEFTPIVKTEGPRDYKSILRIERSIKNSTYQCKASNDYGESTKDKEVITKIHFDVIETPQDKTIEYNTGAKFRCTVKAIPPGNITWYRNESVISNGSSNMLISEDPSTLTIIQMQLNLTGNYKCEAKNQFIVKSFDFNVDISGVGPPTIKEDSEKIIAKEDEEVNIPCEVNGVPPSTIKWYKNETRIYDTENTRILKDSMRLKAALSDTGCYYICVADNKVGIVNKTTLLKVYRPIKIVVPSETTIEIRVGASLQLPCKASGYPAPNINWLRRTNSTALPANHKLLNGTSVEIRRVQIYQEGAYTCIASNDYDSAELTYYVKVLTPPVISNIYTSKTFQAVVDDFALRIQCNATGRPEPVITWTKDEKLISFDSKWYNKEDDGTLVIKNIQLNATGTYVCFAENSLSRAYIIYEVKVSEYPEPGPPSITLAILEDTTAVVKCNIPHKDTDRLRWYKERKQIANGELVLNPAKLSDDGLYTCRVDDMTGTRTSHTQVDIVFKPKFTSVVNFEVADLNTPLICDAYGRPMPEVQWQHNGVQMQHKRKVYSLNKIYDSGLYKCNASNEYGSVTRLFNVTYHTDDCVLNPKHDSGVNKYLILETNLMKWPVDFINGAMIIKKENSVKLLCTDSKITYATCIGNDKFKTDKGVVVKYSDLNCDKEIKPIHQRRWKCMGNCCLVSVGFMLQKKFFNIYEVCYKMNKKNPYPLYTEHSLLPELPDSVRNNDTKPIYPEVYNKLYDCSNQKRTIISILGRNEHVNDKCCFARRQLVNYKDLHPNVPITASFYHLNIIPSWSTCNSNNWDEVEKRVRQLANKARRSLRIYTGVAGQLEWPDITSAMKPIYLENGEITQPVSQYLWKVVIYKLQSSALAIIQVNIPIEATEDMSKYVLCRDICGDVTWMRNPDWHDATRGYIYCCNIKDFKNTSPFNETYHGPTFKYILTDITS